MADQDLDLECELALLLRPRLFLSELRLLLTDLLLFLPDPLPERDLELFLTGDLAGESLLAWYGRLVGADCCCPSEFGHSLAKCPSCPHLKHPLPLCPP